MFVFFFSRHDSAICLSSWRILTNLVPCVSAINMLSKDSHYYNSVNITTDICTTAEEETPKLSTNWKNILSNYLIDAKYKELNFKVILIDGSQVI